jgi:hypothetical protein
MMATGYEHPVFRLTVKPPDVYSFNGAILARLTQLMDGYLLVPLVPSEEAP